VNAFLSLSKEDESARTIQTYFRMKMAQKETNQLVTEETKGTEQLKKSVISISGDYYMMQLLYIPKTQRETKKTAGFYIVARNVRNKSNKMEAKVTNKMVEKKL